ncbi:hypothetical protein ACP6L2_13245 [Sphingobacterium lactis]|uniref:hypothetical protein n=1 Tax=Sphingobacterium lactis TaxID=797291 RepID=UPI003F7D8EC6
MKHIKKKYLYEFSPSDGFDKSKIVNGVRFIASLNGKFIRAFSEKLRVNGEEVLLDLPIPDLTLIYYNMAYLYGKKRESLKSNLGEKLNSIDLEDEDVSKELYSYFGISVSCIILAFTSLESFMNAILPDDKTYERKKSTGVEVYDKENIQRWLGFKEKINNVLPALLRKRMGNIPDMIWKLKELRDNIIHTKSNIGFSIEEKLMNDILDFDFERSLSDIRVFMNFYKPDYIEDCECGGDF